MSSAQALEIIYWFLEEVYDIRKDDLLTTYPKNFTDITQLPLPEKSEACFKILNANILFMHGMAKINQHVPVIFEMILKPEEYASDWKMAISQILDYLNFE